MSISELIATLEKAKAEHGDLEVYINEDLHYIYELEKKCIVALRPIDRGRLRADKVILVLGYLA